MRLNVNRIVRPFRSYWFWGLMLSVGVVFATLESYKFYTHSRLQFLRDNAFKSCMTGLIIGSTLPSKVTRNPVGQPLFSWRVEAMYNLASLRPPYAGKPWTDEYYQSLRLGLMGSEFYCRDDSPETFIFAITGPGTAFDHDTPVKKVDIEGETIVIVEVADSGTHWMQPGDFDIRTMPRTINDESGLGIGSDLGEGFRVGFADGEVWYLSNDVPFEELEKFFTMESAKQFDREQVLGPYRIQKWADR